MQNSLLTSLARAIGTASLCPVVLGLNLYLNFGISSDVL